MIAVLKGFNRRISDHVYQRELDCNCLRKDCWFTLINPELMECFERLRKLCGDKPIHINSSYRCQYWNEMVGGTHHSKHLLGHAIDLAKPKNLTLEAFATYARKAGFDVVIKYEELNFIHCHLEVKNGFSK